MCRQGVEQRLGEGRSAVGLPKLPIGLDDEKPRGITGRIDRWFTRLIVETGIEAAPEAAFLMAIAVEHAIPSKQFL